MCVVLGVGGGGCVVEVCVFVLFELCCSGCWVFVG